MALDVAREAAREHGGVEKIGTTGVALARPMRTRSRGVRCACKDLKHPERFAAKLRELLALHNHVEHLPVPGSFQFSDALRPYMKDGRVLFDRFRAGPCAMPRCSRPMMADVSRESRTSPCSGCQPAVRRCAGHTAGCRSRHLPLRHSQPLRANAAGSGCRARDAALRAGITKACTRVGRPVPDRAGMGEARHAGLGA